MVATEFATTFAFAFLLRKPESRKSMMSNVCFILSLVHENVQEPWNSASPKFLDSLSL